MTSHVPPAAPGPAALALGRDAKPAFPKRFYTEASVAAEENRFALHLDGRTARTPARNRVVVPAPGVAELLASEWNAVEDEIDPRRMPVTRLVNSVIDGVSGMQAEVAAEILRYVASDLILYRADSPPALIELQKAAWDPILGWSAATIGADLTVAAGVVFVEQPKAALLAFELHLHEVVGTGASAPFRLAALHVMTTLTGSALLAMSVVAGRLRPDQAWSAGHVDEDFQIAEWGEDADSTVRRAARWIEMKTAALVFSACGSA